MDTVAKMLAALIHIRDQLSGIDYDRDDLQIKADEAIKDHVNAMIEAAKVVNRKEE